MNEIENLRHTPSIDRAAALYHYFGLTLDDALADFGAVRKADEQCSKTTL